MDDLEDSLGFHTKLQEEDWQTYEEYLKKMKIAWNDFKHIGMQNPLNKGIYLLKMSLKTMDEINKSEKEKGLKKLKNLWQRLGFKKNGLGTYVDFDDNPEKEYLWRRYISDESLERNLFRSMDRIKLTYIIMERTLNSKAAKRSKVLVNSFPFHNRFTLFGEKRMEDDDKSTLIPSGLKGQKLVHEETFEDVVPKGLSSDWSNWVLTPSTKIRDYFGEKVAMYFSFLSFYTLWLLIPSAFGVPLFFIQLFVENFWVLAISDSIFGFVMVAWCAIFYEAWKRREIFYSLKWG